jgi:hypothetical protein
VNSIDQIKIIRLLLEYVSPNTVMPQVLYNAAKTLNVAVFTILLEDCRTTISKSDLKGIIKMVTNVNRNLLKKYPNKGNLENLQEMNDGEIIIDSLQRYRRTNKSGLFSCFS